MSNFIINKDGYIIRPMTLKDVNRYMVNNFQFSSLERKNYYQEYKNFFNKKTSEDANMLFAVLKDDKIIGEIMAESLLDSPCDASVRIVLPCKAELGEKVKNIFVELCRTLFLYDDIYLVPSGAIKKSEIIPIADSSRW